MRALLFVLYKTKMLEVKKAKQYCGYIFLADWESKKKAHFTKGDGAKDH